METNSFAQQIGQISLDNGAIADPIQNKIVAKKTITPTEWDEHTNTLTGSYYMKKFDEISEYDGLAPFNAFEEAAAELIEQVRGLSGKMYSEEGKKEHLKEELKKLGKEYSGYSDEYAADFNESLKNLQNRISRKLASDRDEVGQNPQQQILKNSQFEGEVKTKLYMSQSPMQLAKDFYDLVNTVTDNERTEFGKYLLNNAWMFVERMEKLDPSETEKSRLLKSVQDNIKRLENAVFTKREKALNAMMSKLEHRSGSSSSKRLIQQKVNALIKKYC